MIRSSSFPEKKKIEFYGENYNYMSLKTLRVIQQIFGKFTSPHHQGVVIFSRPLCLMENVLVIGCRYSSVLSF